MVNNRKPLPLGTKLHQGEVIYTIERLIGEGGGSYVYQVESEGHRYALKELYPKMQSNPFVRRKAGEVVSERTKNVTKEKQEDLITNLKKESLLTERLARSNHLIQVIRVMENLSIQLPNKEKSEMKVSNYAILRDLSEIGPVLSEKLQEPLSLKKALSLMKQITQALQSVHFTKEGLSYIHGDIKPNNLFMSFLDSSEEQSNGLLLIDFGSAHEIQKDGYTEWISRENLFVTPLFCAPEISEFLHSFKTKIRLSLASDIYSVMVIFYCMLFGYPKQDEYSYLKQISRKKVKKLAEREHLDIAQEKLIDCLFRDGLAERAKDRILNAGDLLERLNEIDDCLEGKGVTKAVIWHNSLTYVKKRSRYFQTRYYPVGVDKTNIEEGIELTIEGQDSSGLVAPVEEIIESQKNEHLYIAGGGGMGKTTAISKIMKEKLKLGIQIPLYLDVEKYNQETIEEYHSNRNRMYLLLTQLLYNEYYEVDQVSDNYCQLEQLLSENTAYPEYMIIVENLHKVTRNSQLVLGEIREVLKRFKNAQLMISSRKGMDQLQATLLFDHDNANENKSVFTEISLRKLENTNIIEYAKKYFTDSEQVSYVEKHIDNLASLLSIPFFLTRFIANSNLDIEKNVEHEIPMNKGELLFEYFYHLDPIKDDSKKKSNHFFSKLITKTLPRIAYYMEIENKYSLTENELELLMGEPSRTFTQNLALVLQNEILECNEESYYFVHDCYLEFFVAYYIETTIREAVSEQNVEHLLKVNHVWPNKIGEVFFQILGNQLFEEIYLADDEKLSFLEHIYRLLISQSNRQNEYMYNIIPYNFYLISGEQKWLLLCVKLMDPNFAKWVIDGILYQDGRVLLYEEIKDLLGSKQELLENKETLPSYSLELRADEIVDVNVQYKVGKAYYMGERLPLNLELASEWLRKAALAGHLDSQFWLAKMYARGYGVKLSKQEERNWLLKAAKQGHRESQKELARSYLSDKKDSKASKEGIKWYLTAAKKGEPLMQLNLAAYYLKRKEYKQAKKWLIRVTRTNDYYKYEAFFILGWLHEKKSSTVASLSKAIKCYRKAALFGNNEAYIQLIRLYWKEANLKQLFILSKELAEMNYKLPQGFLSWLLHNGVGTIKNSHEAFHWFKKAEENSFDFQAYGWMHTTLTSLQNFISEPEMSKWIIDNAIDMNEYLQTFGELDKNIEIRESLLVAYFS